MAMTDFQAIADFRGDLLAPLQSVIELSAGILAGLPVSAPAVLISDLRNIHSQAHELHGEVLRILAPTVARDSSDLSDPEVRSRVRHDMLNRLNPIINYSEMWAEDLADEGLEVFEKDLGVIASLGKRCMRVIDTILAPSDSDSLPTPDLSPRTHREVPSATPHNPPRVALTGRVLVVDDNELNRDILRRLLESRGHTVECAAGGIEALKLLDEQPVDIILLDMVMPGMNGVEVLQKLKADPILCDIPVLIVSALNEMDCIVECIQLGAEDYLTRPISPVFLQARLGACLDRKRLREKEKLYVRALDDERRRSDELLHVILPGKVIGELKETNRVRPQRHEGVAVLFADIVNFTPYCEMHTPEEVVDQLQAVFEEWEEAALDHGIQKIKTIGDAFMAACGLLVPAANPVLSCVQFGMEMIRIIERMQAGWSLRVGVHYGPLVAGVLGRRQFLFDVFGDTVNTASRMESHGVPGAIVLSESAQRQVAHACHTRQLDSIPVKGKGVIDRFQFIEYCSGIHFAIPPKRVPAAEAPSIKPSQGPNPFAPHFREPAPVIGLPVQLRSE